MYSDRNAPYDFVPKDLTTLSKDDLMDVRTELKMRLNDIQNQLEQYHLSNEEDERSRDEAWRRRAGSARNWFSKELERVKRELSRREDDMYQNKGKAFIRAARIALPDDIYEEIWINARQMFPEAFP